MRHTIDPKLTRGRVPVLLVGAGGNGAQMLTRLARLDKALRALEHPGGLHVTVFDPDTVSVANVGRQLFYPSDVGHPKASVLVHRVNLAFGLDWDAKTARYTGGGKDPANPAYPPMILITCVDSAAARRSIYKGISSRIVGDWGWPIYWLDMGNRQADGQVFLTQPRLANRDEMGKPPSTTVENIGQAAGMVQRMYAERETLATHRLPDLADVLPELLDEDLPEDDAPSCSLAEALERQDLAINDAVTTWAFHLLWSLFRKGGLDQHGYWINLETGRVNPVALPLPLPQEGGPQPKQSRRGRRRAATNG